MTTLKEALSNVSWKIIESRLIELYPDQRSNLEGYEHVYTELLTLTPADNPDYESIDIKWIPSDKHFGDEAGFYDISCVEEKKKEDHFCIRKCIRSMFADGGMGK